MSCNIYICTYDYADAFCKSTYHELRMSFHNLSISVLKVGRQLAGSLAVAAFLLLNLTSCIKEEDPIKPFERGNLRTRSVNMGSDYRNQLYYSFEQDTIIRQNLKTDWDLAFESNTEGVRVFLNSAKFMTCWKTEFQNIEDLKDTIGFGKNKAFDATNYPDSLAIGDIKNIKNAFWIDRGYDLKGEPLEFMKVKFESVTPERYTFKIAKQNESKATTIQIEKNSKTNLVYFSFTTNTAVNLEPPKQDWDLYFTQYVHTFSDPYLPYLVTGVILNPNNTSAIADSTLDFQKIDINIAKNFKLSKRADVIGFNWKNFNNNIYTINTHWNYIIKDSKGFFYKMRFIDFYNERGAKGAPKFEFQKL